MKIRPEGYNNKYTSIYTVVGKGCHPKKKKKYTLKIFLSLTSGGKRDYIPGQIFFSNFPNCYVSWLLKMK
jgi:hypothetical protein